MWIVPWSELAASHMPSLSKDKEQMFAFFIPRRNSWKCVPTCWSPCGDVKNSLKMVPTSEAVTRILPSLVSAITSIEESWALKLVFVLFSLYKATRTWPFVYAGVTSTEFFVSGLSAQRPLGLVQVSIASMSLRSAKL